MNSSENTPVIVKDWDLRLGKQFDEHANRENVMCSLGCALNHVQDRGGDVSKATGGNHIAFVPHVGGEPGYGHQIAVMDKNELSKMRENGARCRHCRGVV